ncbi:MAG: signal peptidase II [Candidatus Tectomicrobia bacterium]|nr:signal peptidase II [Candidatus Tectomicrobia bacterium]
MQARSRWHLLAWVAGLVLVLDQATKLHIHNTFSLYESRPILENFLSLTYVRNSGSAFGLLARYDPYLLRIFFPAVTVLAVVLLVWYLSRVPAFQKLTLWGVCLVTGGAMGNGVDRFRVGQVIDFIDVHWYEVYHWPAFNVADSSICVGVGLLLLDAFRSPRVER